MHMNIFSVGGEKNLEQETSIFIAGPQHMLERCILVTDPVHMPDRHKYIIVMFGLQRIICVSDPWIKEKKFFFFSITLPV